MVCLPSWVPVLPVLELDQVPEQEQQPKPSRRVRALTLRMPVDHHVVRGCTTTTTAGAASRADTGASEADAG